METPQPQYINAFAEDWLRTLESDEYQQGREQLARDADEIREHQREIAKEREEYPDLDSDEYNYSEQDIRYWNSLRPDRKAFCCLGVCTDMAVKRGIIPVEEFQAEDGYPPDAVINAVGLLNTQNSANNRRYDNERGITKLASLNDDERFSFKQIAAEVRAHPENYFHLIEEPADVTALGSVAGGTTEA